VESRVGPGGPSVFGPVPTRAARDGAAESLFRGSGSIRCTFQSARPNRGRVDSVTKWN